MPKEEKPAEEMILPPATEPTVTHEARRTQPTAPRLTSEAEQGLVNQITRGAGFAPHLAIMEIESVRTINVHPAIAIYKAEMLEYLSGRL